MESRRDGTTRLRHLLPLALVCAVLLAAAPEKRIIIYAPLTTYSLTITDHAGRDYIGLLEILEPLGRVTSKPEAKKWKLRYKDIDAVFTPGSSRARVRGRDVELPAPFLLQHDRGLVPLDSLATLLPQFLGTPVTFHTTARRLFIQQNGTTYNTAIAASKLSLNFAAPVNPTIATEAGKVTLVFTRDPVIASGPPTVNFNDNSIKSATFQEANGTAEITVTGSGPLMASFGNGGRTITIAPPPSSATASPTAVSTPAASPQSAPQPPAASLPTAPATPPAHRFLIAIDASHGGDERGAALSSTLSEKDLTLVLARRIRQQLEARGVGTVMLRDADVTLSPDQRASTANTARVSMYLAVHAASDGTGVRIYTAAVSGTGESRGPFLAWNLAQMSYASASQNMASMIQAQLAKAVPARVLTAPLRPLNNIAGPAVAIEIAPRQPGDVADLSSPDYQQNLAAFVAAALVTVRDNSGAPH